MKDKNKSMAQWINLNWNDGFVNWIPLPLLCEKSEATLLVLVGLTAGRRVGGRAGGQAGKYWQFENFKILY